MLGGLGRRCWYGSRRNMIYQLIHCFVCLVLDTLAAAGVATHEKDLEIALLRQQLRVLERKLDTKPHLSRPEKLMLVALSGRLERVTQRYRDWLRQYLLLVKPDTLLKWHRELVRRKWTFQSPDVGGRPRIDAELEMLIIRLVRENPSIGLTKIEDELLKLGYVVDRTTIRNVMRRHHLPPAPQRGRSSWRTFLNHYRTQMLACDFFTVETVTLQTVYVLFFIEMGSRRVHLAGCTTTPNSGWVTQQARQFLWCLGDESSSMRFLMHDHDTKFTAAFDNVFVSEGFEIVLTPFRAPKANAVAERWVRSVRQECLDHLLILNQRHLWKVVTEYTHYYTTARPHQGIPHQAPSPFQPTRKGPIRRRDILGGIIHDYYRNAA